MLLLLAPCAGAGEIVGSLRPPDRVASVSAVDRDAKKTFAGTYDPKTGRYHFTNLPAGTHDIILETTAGRIEGVNLKVGRTEPNGNPTVLKPSDLDRGEIADIMAYLVKLCKDRRGTTASADDGFLAHLRQGKVTSMFLLKGKSGASGTPGWAVPLENDEPGQLGDMLLALAALARVRDQLPPDYDLIVELEKGKPREIRIVPGTPELSEKDRKWLIDWVDNLKVFENKKRVLDLDGTGERARVLVEKLRDEPTSLPVKEPTAFWRIEVFDFKNYYGGWTKEKYTVIVRQQLPIRELRTYRWMFEKRLGGIEVGTSTVTEVPDYEVPEKLDPARSRVPF